MGSTITVKAKPVIGCKFTGRHQFHANSDGTYWEAMPPIEGHALRLQRALMAKPAVARRWLAGRFSRPAALPTMAIPKGVA